MPSVVTNLPALPVCAGSADENAVADTNAVVAICVDDAPVAAVGAVGVPVNAGDAISALSAMEAFNVTAEAATAASAYAVVAALVELSSADCVANVTVAPVNTCVPVHVSPAFSPRSSIAT